MIVSFWGQRAYFSGIFAVTFREGNHLKPNLYWVVVANMFSFSPRFILGKRNPFLTDEYFSKGGWFNHQRVYVGVSHLGFSGGFVPLRK